MLLDDEPDFVVVAEGRNGREAIALVEEHHPDLIVLDHDMPVMTGLEALPHIVEASDTRVVLFSSDAEDLRSKALELGAAAAIPKATGVMTFVEQLRHVMTATGGSDDSAQPSTA